MGQWKEMWGIVGGSAVPRGVSCSNLRTPASHYKCRPGWGSPGGARHAAQGLSSRAADGWGAGDWGAGEDRGRLSAHMTVASLFKDINNWAENRDAATAMSLLSPGDSGWSRDD